jgi:putative ABC transport system permease protein
MRGNDLVGYLKANRLRAFLTILLIATGIMSLVGVHTAIEALEDEVFTNFEKMGANSFVITSGVRGHTVITYQQAVAFKESFAHQGAVSIFTNLGSMPVKRGSTVPANPMTQIIAADHEYLQYRNISLKEGRLMTVGDIVSASPVCMLGHEIAGLLFENDLPTGNFITIAGIRYQVIGTITGTGSLFGSGPDSEIIIPVTSARGHFTYGGTSFNIGVSQSADAHDRAEYIFRGVRRLAPTDANDFKIVRSDSILEKLSKISGIITAVATITGLITLLGAAIGLMNIMLVSVKERTAEIGIRKAVGASAVKIRSQFLVESVAISQIGCIVGTVSGILAGNGVAILLGAAFVIPWMWILCSVVICLVVGVASGYLPAAKAAALNPVEVLGHE